MRRRHEWTPSDADRAWIAALSPSGDPVAAIVHARGRDTDGVWAATTVRALVDGIWHRHPDQAHALLRGRVLTNRPATEADRAIVQLCSRKLGADVTPRPGPLPALPVHWLDDDARAATALHVQHSACGLPATVTPAWLLPEVEAGPQRFRDRAIRAVLLDDFNHPEQHVLLDGVILHPFTRLGEGVDEEVQ